MSQARGKPLAVAGRSSKLTSALRQLTAQIYEVKPSKAASGWRPFARFRKG